MVKWIKTSEELPPLYKRVLCWVKSTNLLGRGGDPVHVFLYERSPSYFFGNNKKTYRWDCENSGFTFGQNVEYWAEIEEPDGV